MVSPMSTKPPNPQIRVNAKTAARLNDYIAGVWKKTKVKPVAQEITSAAINAYLDALERGQKKH